MNLIVHTDGASRGNPGPAAAGFIISDSTGKIIAQSGKFLGTTTNNQAEYRAVLLALTWINKNITNSFQNSITNYGWRGWGTPVERPQLSTYERGRRTGVKPATGPEPQKSSFETTSITFYLDSELVARQLSGQYKIKSQELLPLAIKIKNLQNSLNSQNTRIVFHSIPRNLNKPADRLVNRVLDSKLSSAISSEPLAF